ncbi:DUF4376 domain-containing protein [Oxalobacter aliiformigenes]|uniref:DUF4376 domain-containing protein n=1 Tax=Oxalobacter aliiformigenes TaxID=2946593 RepID=UPI002069E9B7|nr:DUF4376 domain-containing protein [Oxalobacter aliiformigenes]MCZ4064934.1 DUF4376 domain-containing protein [Oxalobacter aliiformigenes]WAW00166.1 DUF4376 domain-containing protein [Oxalobacter aliiformigenes]DAI09730.1 MAG TPA: protein of unknown function (DUF4376) [Caudoviricetes sp.]
MKYGIVENHKFILIDEDRQRLENTIPFMPKLKETDIAPYEDREIERGADGAWYEKGHAPQRPLEEVKTEKLAELETAFNTASQEAHCTSSVGFEIDADETANRNVSSLIVAMEANGEESVLFCAYDNTFHEVTLDQLRIMQIEIITHARAVYARKWALREAIAAAQSVVELESLSIGFSEENE